MSRITSWQTAWHDLLDQDPAASAEGPRPAPPVAHGDDFRLHFGFAMASPACQDACLGVLPHGPALQDRMRALRGFGPLTESDALRLLYEAVARLSALSLEYPGGTTHVTPHTDEVNAVMLQSATITEALGDEVLDRSMSPDLNEETGFLREPLYRLRSTYDVVNFLLWPLVAREGEPDPTDPVARLLVGNWLPIWGPDDGTLLIDLNRDARTPRKGMTG